MAYGVATPTIPVANDIILGEFKAYYNYGLPTELLVGATRDGCKLEIEREIKEIAYDGAYGPTLDTNGVPLVRHEKLNAKLTINNLYLKYFNEKIISDCESDGTWESKDWADTGGTYSAETSIVGKGDQSAKLVASTTAYGIHEVFASAKDLTVFDNEEVSSTSDFIGFMIHITAASLSNLGTGKLKLAFHKDIEGTVTNLFYTEISASQLVADCFVKFKVAKSAFTETGTASWSAVTGVSLQVTGTIGGTITCYIDAISLIQSNTKSMLLPLNGGGFRVTDETTYKEVTADLEILDSDYLDNITLVGQRHDGKKVKIVQKNCLNDGKVELGFEEKDEVVNETTFTSHYTYSNPTVPPIEIYEYTT